MTIRFISQTLISWHIGLTVVANVCTGKTDFMDSVTLRAIQIKRGGIKIKIIPAINNGVKLCHTLREYNRFNAFENRVLERIF
jgi:hypothetical protein